MKPIPTIPNPRVIKTNTAVPVVKPSSIPVSGINICGVGEPGIGVGGGRVGGGVRVGLGLGFGVLVSSGSGVMSVGSGVIGVLVAEGVISVTMGVLVGVGVGVGTASCWILRPTLIDPGLPFAVNFTW